LRSHRLHEAADIQSHVAEHRRTQIGVSIMLAKTLEDGDRTRSPSIVFDMKAISSRSLYGIPMYPVLNPSNKIRLSHFLKRWMNWETPCAGPRMKKYNHVFHKACIYGSGYNIIENILFVGQLFWDLMLKVKL